MLARKNLPSSNLKELLLFVLRRRQRVRIVGNSMLPLLKEGDEVLVDQRAYQTATPAVGEVVVVWHPQRPAFKLIKRVSAIHPDGACFLLGDNPAESSDSRQFGLISAENIIGRVTSRFGG